METVESHPDGLVCPVHLIEKRYCDSIDHTDLVACPERPEDLLGMPIGMHHCRHCGCMVIAGIGHGPHDEGCRLGLGIREFMEDMYRAMEKLSDERGRPSPDDFDD